MVILPFSIRGRGKGIFNYNAGTLGHIWSDCSEAQQVYCVLFRAVYLLGGDYFHLLCRNMIDSPTL